MARLNSRAKGARGELEFAQYLTEAGWTSRRGQQFSGGKDSPDVISQLPYHIEVKRVEKGNLYDWLDQARRDADQKVPIVAHRRSRKQWVVVMQLDDFLKMVW